LSGSQPSAVDEPPQHLDCLPVTAQRPPSASRARSAPLGGQQPRHEQHGLLGDREHGGIVRKQQDWDAMSRDLRPI